MKIATVKGPRRKVSPTSSPMLKRLLPVALERGRIDWTLREHPSLLLDSEASHRSMFVDLHPLIVAVSPMCGSTCHMGGDGVGEGWIWSGGSVGDLRIPKPKA